MISQVRTGLLFTLTLALVGCGGGKGPGGGDSVSAETQENVCILLDLSDRIEPELHASVPSHKDRDVAAVAAVVEHFRSEMRDRGAFFAKGKLRALFSPPPASPKVNEVAAALRIDLANVDPAEKKNVYDNVATWYAEGLEDIYSSVIDSKNYVGADIWRFFAEGQVNDYCIESSSDYRNTLVILTDGYLYHEDSVERVANATSYVTGPLLAREGMRSPSWRAKFESGEYGIMSTPRLAGDLRVLVLEVNPSAANAGDYSILEAYWGKWFEEMGVTNYRFLKTDIPANTRETIMRFLSSE